MIPWFLKTIKEKIKNKIGVSPSKFFRQLGLQFSYGFNMAEMQSMIEKADYKNRKIEVSKPIIITKVDEQIADLKWFEYELDNRKDLV